MTAYEFIEWLRRDEHVTALEYGRLVRAVASDQADPNETLRAAEVLREAGVTLNQFERDVGIARAALRAHAQEKVTQ